MSARFHGAVAFVCRLRNRRCTSFRRITSMLVLTRNDCCLLQADESDDLLGVGRALICWRASRFWCDCLQ